MQNCRNFYRHCVDSCFLPAERARAECCRSCAFSSSLYQREDHRLEPRFHLGFWTKVSVWPYASCNVFWSRTLQSNQDPENLKVYPAEVDDGKIYVQFAWYSKVALATRQQSMRVDHWRLLSTSVGKWPKSGIFVDICKLEIRKHCIVELSWAKVALLSGFWLEEFQGLKWTRRWLQEEECVLRDAYRMMLNSMTNWTKHIGQCPWMCAFWWLFLMSQQYLAHA